MTSGTLFDFWLWTCFVLLITCGVYLTWSGVIELRRRRRWRKAAKAILDRKLAEWENREEQERWG